MKPENELVSINRAIQFFFLYCVCEFNQTLVLIMLILILAF